MIILHRHSDLNTSASLRGRRFVASFFVPLFCGMHCVIVSIGGAESQFNDGTNERYHLLIHHKELEQLRNISA